MKILITGVAGFMASVLNIEFYNTSASSRRVLV